MSADGAAFWNRIAAKYAKAPVRDPAAYAKTLDRVRAYLKPDDSVLELGCGTGSTAIRLADAAGRITATDLAANMVAIGRARAQEAGVSNVAFAEAGLEAACETGTHDVIVAFNLLHLVDDLDAALAHIHAALAPSGLFLSKTPCLARRDVNLKYRAFLSLAIPVMQLFGKAPSLDRIGTRELEDRVKAAGFEILETGDYPAMPPSHFIAARKAG